METVIEATNKYKNPVLFEVNIHHICWFCDVTEKNRDAEMVSISVVRGRNYGIPGL